jgi:hypothetical protein
VFVLLVEPVAPLERRYWLCVASNAVLKDLAEEKELRRRQAHEDGKPLGPAFASLLVTADDLVILGLPGPPPGH